MNSKRPTPYKAKNARSALLAPIKEYDESVRNTLLKDAYSKIKIASEFYQKTRTVYTIPEWIFGLPEYDRNVEREWLIQQLRDDGYTANRWINCSISLSW